MADPMKRRRVLLLRSQEARWKGRRRTKLWYSGKDAERNGVVATAESFIDSVIAAQRVKDRVMPLTRKEFQTPRKL